MFSALFPSAGDFPLPPPPQELQHVVLAVCLVSILLPAGVLRLGSGAVLFGLFFYGQSWTSEASFRAYIVGNACVGEIYRWLDLVAIHNPEKDFWQEQELTGVGGIGPVTIFTRAPKGRWEKLKWWTNLWMSRRGVGWNICSKNIPLAVPIDYPTSLWLMQSTSSLVLLYLTTDVLSNILSYISIDEPFFDQPIWWQVSFAWLEAFRSYYGLEFAYCLASIIAVVLNISIPNEWPPISGYFRREGYTVRNMWGKCWHQIMRRPCSEAGRIVNQICGFRKGSFASRYSQIWVAFAVSAAMHHAGARMGCFKDGGLLQAAYFMIQPVAFMAEDFAMWAGKRMGMKDSVLTRRLGFAWVFLWFSITVRDMVASRPISWYRTFEIPSMIQYFLR